MIKKRIYLVLSYPAGDLHTNIYRVHQIIDFQKGRKICLSCSKCLELLSSEQTNSLRYKSRKLLLKILVGLLAPIFKAMCENLNYLLLEMIAGNTECLEGRPPFESSDTIETYSRKYNWIVTSLNVYQKEQKTCGSLQHWSKR